MVVAGKKATLDVEVKVDDTQFVRATAGIAGYVRELQEKAARAAQAIAEVAKTKEAIRNLAALAKEAAATGKALGDMEQQLVSITKSKEKAAAATQAIRTMMEYKPAAVAAFHRPPGTYPDYVPPNMRGGGGRAVAGVSAETLPIILSLFSPAVIGGLINKYDPFMKGAANRYFFDPSKHDPMLNEYLLGTTPGFLYGATRAGIDRWRYPEGLYPERPPGYDAARAGSKRATPGLVPPYSSTVPTLEPDPYFTFALPGGPGADTLHFPEETLDGLEEIEAAKEKYQAKGLNRIRAMAEEYASFVDPAPYIVEGLKSGEIRRAIEDFAEALGTKAAEELVHELVVMGIMAILQIITGGASQGATIAMGRGGIVKAQAGLLGTLPARPGGHHFRFGDALINAAEAGEDEVLGIFPKGQRGRDLITGPLARMFNIPVIPAPRFTPPHVNVETKVETRPTFNTTLELRDHDPHDIKLAHRVEKGRVNRLVTVRT